MTTIITTIAIVQVTILLSAQVYFFNFKNQGLTNQNKYITIANMLNVITLLGENKMIIASFIAYLILVAPTVMMFGLVVSDVYDTYTS